MSKEKVDLLRKDVEKEFTLTATPLIDNFSNDFDLNIRAFYLEAKEKYDLIQNVDTEKIIREQTAFKSLLKRQYSSQAFKDFFNDLNLEGYYLDDKISKLHADDRTINSFLILKKTIKGSPCDFFSVCLGVKGWKNYKPNNLPIKIKNTEQYIQSETLENSHSQEDQTFKIPGAMIIDEDFVENLKNYDFTMAEFYTAKQNDNCQWYGVMKGWDVERKNYHAIKNTVENAFEKERTYKVSAVVHGDGGSGKSTLLRRVALDLAENNQFTVLWLQNNEFHSFQSHGIEAITENKNTNFIVIIEDWYRIANDEELNKRFLEKTKSINNIRLLIGDRNISGKIYIDNLYNPDNLFHLSPDENKNIIEKIILNVPQWKGTFYNLNINSHNNFHPSLFLFLFIVAKLNEDEYLQGKIDLSEPHTAFIEIIKNDLKYICDKGFSGVAKSLYYWACIYNEQRIGISYDIFLEIANLVNEKKDKDAKKLSNFSFKNDILEKLKTYFHINRVPIASKDKTPIQSANYSEDENRIYYIQFNHDILADFGLSRALLKNWDAFDDVILNDILKIVVEKGNPVLSSIFLNKTVSSKGLNLPKEQILSYIDVLIGKKNTHDQYTNIISAYANTEEFIKYAHKMISIENYAENFWKNLFKVIGGKEKTNFAIQLLSKGNIPPGFMVNNSIILVDRNTRFSFYESLIQKNNFSTINYILTHCIENFKIELSETVIHSLNSKWIFFPFEVLKKVLMTLGKRSIADQFLCFVLKNLDFKNLHERELLFFAIEQSQDQPLVLKTVKNLLCSSLLTENEKINLILNNQLKRFSKNQLLKEFDIDFDLRDPDEISTEIFFRNIDQSFALFFLKKWKKLRLDLFFLSFRLFENSNHDQIYLIIKDVITSFNKDKKRYLPYLERLLGVQLNDDFLWRGLIRNVFENRRSYSKGAILNALISHIGHPEDTAVVCENILREWENEVYEENYYDLETSDMGGFFPINYHVAFALKHPCLTNLSVDIFESIRSKEPTETVPYYILYTVNHFLLDFGVWSPQSFRTQNDRELIFNCYEGLYGQGILDAKKEREWKDLGV